MNISGALMIDEKIRCSQVFDQDRYSASYVMKIFSRYKKEQPVVYVQLYKRLYRLIGRMLLFYQLNPYEPCMATLTTQPVDILLVLWHMDNLKAFSKDP